MRVDTEPPETPRLGDRSPSRRGRQEEPASIPSALIVPTTVFSPVELQGARERLTSGDGLHRLLASIGGDEASDSSLPLPARLAAPGFFRRHRASVATVFLYLALVVIPGFLISAFGDRFTSREFVRLTDWREFSGALFLYLVLAPVLWTFYLWQPRLIVEVFAGLAQSGAIGPARRADIAADAVLRRMGGSFVETAGRIRAMRVTKGALLAALSLAASVATLLVWPPTALPPVNRLFPDSDLFWWQIVPVYFWAVWLPLVFVNVYMLVWIVIRQTVMIANIQRLLSLFEVEPIPFHPDGSCGFAPIGSYATNIVRIALIIGAWALVLLLSGPVTGHGVYVAPHILFLVIVQVLLTPYLLFGPVWYAHRVMRAARERALQRVGDAIRTSLLGDVRPSAARMAREDRYQELEAQYRLVEEGYETWPFGRTAFSGVSITAGVTLAGNVAAILYRMYIGT
ncbi:MAG TPA: hypothetical protein VGR22_04650 [Thermomicrobiales bacterium]|nr:hypothetical protein [Thermomicrobiales bacterium]